MFEIKKYKVAAIQFESTLGDKKGNIKALLELSVEAAENGAKLIVLPEMATTGYCFYSRDEITPLVETIPGPTTASFLEVCEQYMCYIVVGMPEIDQGTGHYYNSAVLIGPGDVKGSYRKTHPFASDPKWAKDGDKGFPVFQTELGRIGMLICMDYYYFEPARLLALQGADVLCNPTNWCDEKCPAPSWHTRAWENGVFLISADRWGVEREVQFSGGTSIINPDGVIQNYLDDGNGIVYGEVNLEQSRQKEPANVHRLAGRRSELYYPLTLNTYLWNPLYFHRLYNHKPLPKGKKSVIAVGQFEPLKGDETGNLATIANLVAEASAAKAELLVLPELALSGTASSREEAEEWALGLEQKTGADGLIADLIELTRQNNIFLVFGVIEKDRKDKKLFNTIILLGQSGIIGKYRKTHLNEQDKIWAVPGENKLPWYNLPLGRIGLLTGDDSLFPETTMTLAVSGADLLCIPSAISGPKPGALKSSQISIPGVVPGDDNAHWHLWRTRAVETSSYVAFANRGSSEYMGYSGIFGPFDNPRDEQLAEGRDTCIISMSMDTGSNEGVYPAAIARAKEMVKMRLPHLYGPLVEK